MNPVLAPDPEKRAEERKTDPSVPHAPSGLSDRFALGFTKLLRFTADTFSLSATATAPELNSRPRYD